jgi:FkbM family methyltransferase
MPISKGIFRVYALAIGLARATGLTKPLRKVMGPLAGRIITGVTGNSSNIYSVNGHKMVLTSSGAYPPVAMAMDNYESETTEQFERTLTAGMVVLDIGAHVGYYSLLAARLVGPSGKVFSFEPEIDNYQLLRQNIELNGYENIYTNQCAVSNKVGETTLFLANLDSGRHSIYNHSLPQKGSYTVPTVTIDSFLEEQGWPKVDLVKIDVEGAEPDVLEGMGQTVKRSSELKLIMEFNPTLLMNSGTDPDRFLETPTAWGKKIFSIDGKAGLTPIDPAEWPDLVKILAAKETSINLYCSS